jgi:adenylate kinase
MIRSVALCLLIFASTALAAPGDKLFAAGNFADIGEKPTSNSAVVAQVSRGQELMESAADSEILGGLNDRDKPGTAQLNRQMRIVLLGAPGSGKGTQAKKLVADFGYPQVSTGDLLRDAVARGTEYGKLAKAAMDAGQLVSDEIVLGILKDRIAQPDAANGFILDGFPRNLVQARALESLLADLGQQLDVAVLLDVDQDILFKRLTGRRICKICGRAYNVHFLPPPEDGRCETCGGELVQRSDDREETIGHRLEVYRAQTEPVIEYFRGTGKLKVVDAEGGFEEVHGRLLEALELPRPNAGL